MEKLLSNRNVILHGSVKNLIGKRFGRLTVVGVDGKRIHLGYFDSSDDAVDARKSAQAKLWPPAGQALVR
jgi:hypothetical protein